MTVALVVGGASGIGRAVAARLAVEGHATVAADLPGRGDPPDAVRFEPVDVTDGAAVDRLFDRVHDSPGDPDVVVVSAGIGVHERLDEGDPEEWRRVLEVNLLGALRIVRAFVPAMRARGSGHVAIVTSVAARGAYPYGGVYGASKAGLAMAAETLRLECLPQVRVTTVAPGVVDTPFFDRIAEAGVTPATIGWGALEPDDVASAVLFALQQPPRVAVGSITLRPAAQPL